MKCYFSIDEKENKKEINISLHIRNFNNNDVCKESEREYFNKSSYIKSFYINLINNLKNKFNDQNKQNKQKEILHFHIYSQYKNIEEKEQFNELIEHIKNIKKVKLNENGYSIIENENIKVSLHLNENEIETLHHMIKSDVLVLAKSSFSAIANYYSRGINIILNSFWHKLNPNTIFSDIDGNFKL
jgi:hemoglobin-like flavoprotein